MILAAVGRAFPGHYYPQEELLGALTRLWGDRFHNKARLEQIHRNVLVGGRHLALPIDDYPRLTSFTATNDAFIRCATELGARAIGEALRQAELAPGDIDHLMFVSSTGIATPSIDARLVNRLGLSAHVKRTPMFGLGCVAGAAGVARLTDDLAAHPEQVAVLLSVELCSLTLQMRDMSIANIISSGLFGDGAAAVVLAGKARAVSGPRVVASCSVFYPDSEHVMGWEIGSDGFQVVLSADVPQMVRRFLRRDVDRFLEQQGLSLRDIRSYVCHPGGPKVLQAMQQALELSNDALALSWESLTRVGNLSSASVLMILAETMRAPPPAGSYGLMFAMGPGFCSELVLLQW